MRIHVAISVDIDRYSNRELRKWLHMFRPLGCRTVEDIRAKCREARAEGLDVFPPCDNTKPDGHCAGHEEA